MKGVYHLLIIFLTSATSTLLIKSSSNERDYRSAYYGEQMTLNSRGEPVLHFICSDKENDMIYEHTDCHKYWHCLYVGTVFELALERKCPVGTMFHRLSGTCEISTMVTI
jgi:hypothetical protein